MHSLIQTSDDFIAICKQVISNDVSSKLGIVDSKSLPFTVSVVWYSQQAPNHIGVFSTTLPDLKYYTAMYNGVANQLYLDTYVKIDNKIYQIGAPNENTETIATNEPESVSAEE